jgi:hypothetical protein
MSIESLFELGSGSPKEFTDYIVLGGRQSPGKAVIRDASSPRRWNILEGYGLVGASIIYAGSGLAKFNVDIYAWEDAHFTAWESFAGLLGLPKAVRDPGAISIVHPQLNAPPLSISQVVVGDVTQWEQVDDGLWCRTIPMIAYRKPVPLAVRAKEAPPGSKLSTPIPKSISEQAVDTASAQNAALAFQLAEGG